MTGGQTGWSGVVYGSFSDVELFRRRLDAGADPLGELWQDETPLHVAARNGSPEVVFELASRARDVDALSHGRSALWNAVYHGRDDNARVLLRLGADPWRPMMAGWPPGRLGAVGPLGDLFEVPAGQAPTGVERAMADAGFALAEVFSGIVYDGYSVTCVAGVSAEEAVHRLPAGEGVVVDGDVPPHELDFYGEMDVVGVTGVPGGCVIAQPWGYRAGDHGLMAALTPGTFAYGMYANPKSGDQGRIAEDGRLVKNDLHPGHDPYDDTTAREVLASYASRGSAIVHCLVYAGLRPASKNCLERPDTWLRLT